MVADIIFAISYYLVWFAALYLVMLQKPWLGLLTIILVSVIQAVVYRRRFLHLSYLRVIALWTLVGFLLDCLAQLVGLVRFDGAWYYPIVPWMLGMWGNFGLVCLISRTRLYQLGRLLRPIAVLGFPLAYAAGIRMGAAHTDVFWLYMGYLAFFGGVIFPWIFIRTCPE